MTEKKTAELRHHMPSLPVVKKIIFSNALIIHHVKTENYNREGSLDIRTYLA